MSKVKEWCREIWTRVEEFTQGLIESTHARERCASRLSPDATAAHFAAEAQANLFRVFFLKKNKLLSLQVVC
jgi:hypothetical protein